VRNTAGAKVFMLLVSAVAIVAGIYGGVWFFDRFS
jgi:hypothetical protein